MSPEKKTTKTPMKPKEDFAMPEKPYKKIAVTFISLTTVLVLIIVYFSLSKAEIVLTPGVVAQEKEFAVNLPLNATSSPSVLSAEHELVELDIVKSYGVGEFETVDGKSEGLIRIVNEHTKSQKLIATTRFLNPDGLLYRLKDGVEVPAGGEVTAEIVADETGGKYDIAPARFTIPGLSDQLQKVIYGVSEEAFTGGVRKVGTLSLKDITDAKNDMTANMKAMVSDKLGLEEDEKNIVLMNYEIMSEEVSNTEGDEVEQFTLSYMVMADVIKINKEKMIAWTKEQYKKDLGDIDDVINYDSDSFEYDLEKLADTFATIKSSASAHIMSDLDVDNFDKKKLYGMDEQALRIYFSQYTDIKEVNVSFWPFWVRTAPSMKDHINISIKN